MPLPGEHDTRRGRCSAGGASQTPPSCRVVLLEPASLTGRPPRRRANPVVGGEGLRQGPVLDRQAVHTRVHSRMVKRHRRSPRPLGAFALVEALNKRLPNKPGALRLGLPGRGAAPLGIKDGRLHLGDDCLSRSKSRQLGQATSDLLQF